MKPSSQLFTIQQISQKCCVPKSTLRFWEKRLEPLFSPIRSPGGQRRYMQQHIDLIGRIKQLQADGLSLENMRQALEQTVSTDPEPMVVVELDRLADRVAGFVKEEVYRFLREGPIANLSDNIKRTETEQDANPVLPLSPRLMRNTE
jgi:DNA-binding transcriptional MerR regulator